MKTVTYSKNIFLPVTDLCRNRCGYCSFRKDAKEAHLLPKSRAMQLLEEASLMGCTEALFTMGERPWAVPGFKEILSSAGVSDLMDYLVELSELAIEHGLLPHTNAGLLDEEDLQRLQPYNASMGLMLETTANLIVHTAAPGKMPQARLEYMELAGKLKIPFTTGILIGIGECWQDRLDAIAEIARIHETFGHIQEVIIQPLDPKPQTLLQCAPRPMLAELCRIVDAARRILPSDVAVQIPPNLADPGPLLACGASDLGGISPLTADGINPDRPWPGEVELHNSLSGYDLRERLPVYPKFIALGWHGEKTRSLVASLAGEDGLRAKKYIF
jgi:FO synthase subunit 1